MRDIYNEIFSMKIQFFILLFQTFYIASPVTIVAYHVKINAPSVKFEKHTKN